MRYISIIALILLSGVTFGQPSSGIPFSPRFNDYSGFANYQDTTYDAASPLVLAAGDTITLPFIADVVYDAEKPIDITTFWNNTDTTITGRFGDSYAVTFEYVAEQNSASKTKFTWWIDIGGTIEPLYSTSTSFNDGNNSVHANNKSTIYYTLDT